MSTGPDRSIETLIRLAGEREMPSDEATLRARTAAEQSWQRMLQEAPRARMRIPLALAATLTLAVLGWYAWTQRDPADYPFVHQAAAQLREHDDREQFLAGIDLFLAGIETIR